MRAKLELTELSLLESEQLENLFQTLAHKRVSCNNNATVGNKTAVPALTKLRSDDRLVVVDLVQRELQTRLSFRAATHKLNHLQVAHRAFAWVLGSEFANQLASRLRQAIVSARQCALLSHLDVLARDSVIVTVTAAAAAITLGALLLLVLFRFLVLFAGLF